MANHTADKLTLANETAQHSALTAPYLNMTKLEDEVLTQTTTSNAQAECSAPKSQDGKSQEVSVPPEARSSPRSKSQDGKSQEVSVPPEARSSPRSTSSSSASAHNSFETKENLNMNRLKSKRSFQVQRSGSRPATGDTSDCDKPQERQSSTSVRSVSSNVGNMASRGTERFRDILPAGRKERKRVELELAKAAEEEEERGRSLIRTQVPCPALRCNSNGSPTEIRNLGHVQPTRQPAKFKIFVTNPDPIPDDGLLGYFTPAVGKSLTTHTIPTRTVQLVEAEALNRAKLAATMERLQTQETKGTENIIDGDKLIYENGINTDSTKKSETARGKEVERGNLIIQDHDVERGRGGQYGNETEDGNGGEYSNRAEDGKELKTEKAEHGKEDWEKRAAAKMFGGLAAATKKEHAASRKVRFADDLPTAASVSRLPVRTRPDLPLALQAGVRPDTPDHQTSAEPGKKKPTPRQLALWEEDELEAGGYARGGTFEQPVGTAEGAKKRISMMEVVAARLRKEGE